MATKNVAAPLAVVAYPQQRAPARCVGTVLGLLELQTILLEALKTVGNAPSRRKPEPRRTRGAVRIGFGR